MRALRRRTAQLDARGDQVPEQVGLVVVMRALHDRGDPLEPHAGVDRGSRQVDPLVGRDLLELHEHQIPDLDEAVAVLIGAAGRAPCHVRPVIVEDLRAGATGAGLAHGPEIVRGRDAYDALFGQSCDPAPEPVGLVVLGEDRDHEALFRQAVVLRHQPPRELDGALLEVVAEREVAQHLEEGVVARGVADVVQVVVLAARAHALLGGGGTPVRPGLGTGKDVLELHHAGVGEHQRRVVARHERARGHDPMLVGGEIVEKLRADLVDAWHGAVLHVSPGGGRPGGLDARYLVRLWRAVQIGARHRTPVSARPAPELAMRPERRGRGEPRRRAASRRRHRDRRAGGWRG